MAHKNNRYLARLVTEDRAPCAFCHRDVDDEIIYGKLYAIGDIQCHYFCCLLSCCLIQKGHDEEGLFGFMYTDIIRELERCKKHKCSYCGRNGASLGCSVGACRKQFHLPCGRERNAVSLYLGCYKTFCQQHAPKQKIPEHIMSKARLRMRAERKGQLLTDVTTQETGQESEDMLCVICYEPVDAYPTVNTFWPPCCAKDGWLHRTCLQRMALSAGMHYLKCPLCNDKHRFHEALMEQGYYVPDRDAAWELEQGAFAEIYERSAVCSVTHCHCPHGREHTADTGKWDMKLCLLCGSAGAHSYCIDQSKGVTSPSHQSEMTTDSIPGVNQSQATTGLNQPRTNETIEANSSQVLSNISIEPLSTETKTTLSVTNVSNVLSQSKSSEKSESNIFCNVQSNQISETNTQPSKVSDSNVLCQEQSSEMNIQNGLCQVRSTETNLQNGLCQVQSSVLSESEDSAEKSEVLSVRFVCASCLPAAPKDLNGLAACIEAIMQQEQAQTALSNHGPIMPSRMSIRRTKGTLAVNNRPSTSRYNNRVNGIEADNRPSDTSNVMSSRLSLNLKPPRAPPSTADSDDITLKNTQVDGNVTSPFKLLEMFKKKLSESGLSECALDAALHQLRHKLNKPRPLCDKKRLLNETLDKVLADIRNNSVQRQVDIEWSSPKKSHVSVEHSHTHTPDKSTRSTDRQNKEYIYNMNHTPTKSPRNVKVEDISFTSRIMRMSDIQEHDTEDHYWEIITENSDVIENVIHNVKFETDSNETEHDYETPNDSTEDAREKIRDGNYINNIKSESKFIVETMREENGDDYKINNDKSDGSLVEVTRECQTLSEETHTAMAVMQESKHKEINESDSEINTTEDTEVNSQEKSSNDFKNNSSKSKTVRKGISKKSKGIRKKRKQFSRKNNDLEKNINLKKIESSKNDANVLKRLLIEKDLCTRLFLELTTGKKDDQNSVNHNNTEDIHNTEEIKNAITQNKSFENEINVKKEQDNPKSYAPSKEILEKDVNNTPKVLNNSKKLTVNKKHANNRKKKHTNNRRKCKAYNTPRTTRLNRKNSRRGSKNTTKSSENTIKSTNKNGNPINTKSSTKAKLILENSKQMPSEFETQEPINQSTNHLGESPNHTSKCKTVEMKQDSSLEISENDQSIDINVIKVKDNHISSDAYKNFKIKLPESRNPFFKFSSLDKETLDKNDVGVDLESFKKEYLSEVDREFQCSYNHEHVNNSMERVKTRSRSPIDFAMDAIVQSDGNTESDSHKRKRKKSEGGIKLNFRGSEHKKRKTSESGLKLVYNSHTVIDNEKSPKKITRKNPESYKKKQDIDKRRIKKLKRITKKNKRSSDNKNIEVTIDSTENLNVKNKKIKTKFAIKNQNIHVKIKWKKEQLSLNIESKKTRKEKRTKERRSNFKQYVLQFDEGSSKEVLVKPEKELFPIKRKYVKQEKSPDKMKQTSIHSFFKIKHAN